MIGRRDFLKGLAAALASAALPKVDAPQIAKEDVAAVEITADQIAAETITTADYAEDTSDWSAVVEYQQDLAWAGDSPFIVSHGLPQWSATIEVDYTLPLGEVVDFSFKAGGMAYTGKAMVRSIAHTWINVHTIDLEGIGELHSSLA